MVFHTEFNQNMIQDEPMSFTLHRYRRNFRDAKAFEDTHRRVHYCCYGPNLCPICPAIESFESALGDMDWLITQLHKKYKLQVIRKIKKNKTWTWAISSIPKDTELRT